MLYKIMQMRHLYLQVNTYDSHFDLRVYLSIVYYLSPPSPASNTCRLAQFGWLVVQFQFDSWAFIRSRIRGSGGSSL
jgi:hypothetical protein